MLSHPSLLYTLAQADLVSSVSYWFSDLSVVSRVLIWAQIPHIRAYYNDLEINIFLFKKMSPYCRFSADFLQSWHILIENYILISLL